MKISSISFEKQYKKRENETIKGVLLNNYIQKHVKEDNFSSLDEISTALLIPENISKNQENKIDIQDEFDYKKTLKPLIIFSASVFGAVGAISLILKGYSSKIANKNDIVVPPDLARNINILEEPHFALYRALREPNTKNVLGFGAVCLMSGITLAAKNLIDGVKEIWVKKQQFDIDHDFQKNMIEVETDAFCGKLNVVNEMLKNTSDYFKLTLSEKKNVFKGVINPLNFKGESDKNNKKDDKNYKIPALIALSTLAAVGIAFGVFKNFQKTVKNLDTFTQKFEDKEIRLKIDEAVKNPDKNKAMKLLSDIMQVINATDETMEENFSKINGINSDEIQKAIEKIKKNQIYAKAPEALGGISEKIQYYCYINEERGHLYNWVLNPENPFNKYLFLGFSLLSSIGYVSKNIVDAIKETTVHRENSKNELNLKKSLVEVEINNFKSKKESAINPLIENYKLQLKKGKSKQELENLAENILIEIKNGPPYVYS